MHRGRSLITSMCSLCISQIIYVFSSALNPGNKGTALIRSWVPVVVTITFDFVWHSPLTGSFVRFLHFCYIFRYIYYYTILCILSFAKLFAVPCLKNIFWLVCGKNIGAMTDPYDQFEYARKEEIVENLLSWYALVKVPLKTIPFSTHSL